MTTDIMETGKMMINSHSHKRMIERNIPLHLIKSTIRYPDKIVKEIKRKVLYQKEINGRELDVVMRRNMIVTTYWK